MATAKSADSTKSITIPEVKRVWLDVELIGETPLLTNAFGEEAKQKVEDDQAGKPKIKEHRDPVKDYQQSIYWLDDEHTRYAFPAGGIKRAMVSAGQRFAGERGTELMGAFSIPAEWVEIIGAAPRMRTDRVILAGVSRPMSLAYRAEFMPWTINVPIVYMAPFMTEAQVLNLLKLAGTSVGIGAWRLEKKGTFGQFTIGRVVQKEY